MSQQESVFGMVLLFLAAVPAASVAAPNSSESYASPQECFEAARAALEKQEFRKYATCFTPESQTQMVSGFVRMPTTLKVKIDSLFAKVGNVPALEGLKKWQRDMNDVLTRHGIDLEQLPSAADEIAGRAEGDPRLRVAAQAVKDKPAFVADFFGTMQKLDKWNSKTVERLDGTIGGLVMDGANARAIFTPSPTNPKHKKSTLLFFRKQGDGWLMVLPARWRTWKSTAGTTVKARFLSVSGGMAKLRREDGEVITVPVDKLSPEDQTWIKNRGN